MLSAENSTEKLMSRTNFCPSDIWNSEWQKVQMYLWKIAPEDKCYDTILPLTWFFCAWQWGSLFLAMWNKKNVLFSYCGVELKTKDFTGRFYNCCLKSIIFAKLSELSCVKQNGWLAKLSLVVGYILPAIPTFVHAFFTRLNWQVISISVLPLVAYNTAL